MRSVSNRIGKCQGRETNDGYVDVLFTCGECDFGFLGSWFYSREWVWNLGTKSMLK